MTPSLETTERFDKAYFDRYYRDPATRSATRDDAQRQADFITAYLRYLRVSIRHVVDIGCGLGHLLQALQAAMPRARMLGVDTSEYLCERFGWQYGSLPHYSPPRPFDLVICHDVVAYLDDDAAAGAIATLARATRKALFFAALTVEDLALCDRARTDTDVHLRPNEWYRHRLGRHFEAVGGGLWLKKPADAVIWSLDRR